jgi:hypothetical protein
VYSFIVDSADMNLMEDAKAELWARQSKYVSIAARG